jgi:hypothetical protein
MYYFLTSFSILIIAIALVIITNKTKRRLEKIEKKLFSYLKSVDDKNYKLWKSKLKSEEINHLKEKIK